MDATITRIDEIADLDAITPADMRREARDLEAKGDPWSCHRLLLEGDAQATWVLLSPATGRAGVCDGGDSRWYDADSAEEAVAAHRDGAADAD